MNKLSVSIATFGEIAGLLEAQGIKINKAGGEIVLQQGTFLVPPVDYRIVTIRRDILVEATKIFAKTDTTSENLIDFCEKLFKWVHIGEKPTSTQTEWK